MVDGEWHLERVSRVLVLRKIHSRSCVRGEAGPCRTSHHRFCLSVGPVVHLKAGFSGYQFYSWRSAVVAVAKIRRRGKILTASTDARNKWNP